MRNNPNAQETSVQQQQSKKEIWGLLICFEGNISVQGSLEL